MLSLLIICVTGEVRQGQTDRQLPALKQSPGCVPGLAVAAGISLYVLPREEGSPDLLHQVEESTSLQKADR